MVLRVSKVECKANVLIYLSIVKYHPTQLKCVSVLGMERLQCGLFLTIIVALNMGSL